MILRAAIVDDIFILLFCHVIVYHYHTPYSTHRTDVPLLPVRRCLVWARLTLRIRQARTWNYFFFPFCFSFFYDLAVISTTLCNNPFLIEIPTCCCDDNDDKVKDFYYDFSVHNSSVLVQGLLLATRGCGGCYSPSHSWLQGVRGRATSLSFS